MTLVERVLKYVTFPNKKEKELYIKECMKDA